MSGIGEGDEQSEEMQIARWLAGPDGSPGILAKPKFHVASGDILS
ncbi:hypothetical protein ACFLVV_03240 [Chloroflexota bacterium]